MTRTGFSGIATFTIALFAAGGLVAAAGCGSKTKPEGTGVGDDHVAPPDDLDGAGGSVAVVPDAGVEPVEPPLPPEPPRPPVTFALINDGTEDLVFSVDKGWQPVIFAFSGKPPKAVPLVMFATAYTASCDVAEAELCPKAPPRPERNRDEAAAEKRETVLPGATLEVPWDAMSLAYEKTKSGRRKCQCYRPVESAAGDYTVRACGLRRVMAAKGKQQQSKLQCIDAAMTLPAPDGAPQTIELHFPAP